MAFPKKEQVKKKLGWKELPEGAVISSCQSREKKTGNWASMKPVWDSKKCVQCWLCALYCPESCIPVDSEGRRGETEFDYCKGCGICAAECPVKAILMKRKE
ncbi:MAG: 4Fe-4S binding protein [Candidatus Aenigmatarchaeota archaeon]